MSAVEGERSGEVGSWRGGYREADSVGVVRRGWFSEAELAGAVRRAGLGRVLWGRQTYASTLCVLNTAYRHETCR